MAKTDGAASSGGIGFGGLLALLFIGLKLTGYIDWSWWWVLSPIWGVFAILMAVAGVALVFAGIVAAIDAVEKRRTRARLFKAQ